MDFRKFLEMVNEEDAYDKDVKPSKKPHDKEAAKERATKAALATKKKSLKDWFEQIDKNLINEAEQLTIEPAKQSTQVIKQGTKTLGTVNNPALAATIKSAIGKGEMSLAGDQLKEEEPMMEKAPPGMEDVVLSLKKKFPGEEGRAYAIAWSMYNKKHGKNEAAEDNPDSAMLDEKWAGDAKIKATGEYSGKSVEELKSMLSKLHKSGPHKAGSPEAKKQHQINFALRSKGGWKKGEGAALKEVDQPTIDNMSARGAGLGAGRNPDVLETKQVNESMNTLEAAYHEGKAHGLSKHGYTCRYNEGSEEHKRYHDGFKEGLDECYGLMPNRGLVVSEVESGQDVVDNMASFGAKQGSLAESNLVARSNDSATDIDLDIVDPNTMKKVASVLGDSFNGQIYIGDDVYTWEAGGERITNKEGKTIARNMTWDVFLTKKLGKQIEDEGGELLGEMDKTEYMKHKAKTTPGDTFKAFGQTFKDKEVLETDAFAFESLDKQLNDLLNEGTVAEGLSVNMSQGLGGPMGQTEDSVSVTAQGDDASKLLAFIKQVGLGGLGAEQSEVLSPAEPIVAVASDYGAPKFGGYENEPKSMMDLMKVVSGGEDYKDEEHGEHDHGHDHHEEKCDECGSMMTAEGSCDCDEGQEMVDEVQTPDQLEADAVSEDDGEGYEQSQEAGAQIDASLAASGASKGGATNEDGMESNPEAAGAVAAADADEEQEAAMSESSFLNLYKKISWLAEESTKKEDEKAEKAGKKVAKDIEDDEGHKGKDDDKAEKAGKKVTKDIEYDDKKDRKEKKLDEWANEAGKDGTEQSFERDIEFMTKVIAGGLNKPKSTGQQTIPVLAGDKERTGDEDMSEFKRLAGLGQ